MLAEFLDPDRLVAIGALLSGIGSLLVGIVAIRMAGRKQEITIVKTPSETHDETTTPPHDR